MKITKTKSGTYRTVVNLGRDPVTGKQFSKTVTAKTKTECRRRAEAMRVEMSGRNITLMTFEEAAELFIKRQEPNVSANTVRDYRSRLRVLCDVCPGFTSKRLEAISGHDVQDLLNLLQKPHSMGLPCRRSKKPGAKTVPGVSGKTARNYWGFINSVCESQKIRIDAPTLPGKVQKKIYVPDDSDVRVMLGAASGQLAVCIRLAAFGPMREGEIAALNLDDIDGNVIHVHKDIAYREGGGYEVKNTPKSYAGNRYIEMDAETIRLIREQGYVTSWMPRQINYHFNKLLRDNNLPHMRFHDLRHYAASVFHAQGVPDAYIMRRGGWATDTTLKNVYRHTLADMDTKETRKILDHIDALSQKKSADVLPFAQ